MNADRKREIELAVRKAVDAHLESEPMGYYPPKDKKRDESGVPVLVDYEGSINLSELSQSVTEAVRPLIYGVIADILKEQPVALHQHLNTVNGLWEECNPKWMDAIAETHPKGSAGVRKLYQLPPVGHNWEQNNGYPDGYERK